MFSNEADTVSVFNVVLNAELIRSDRLDWSMPYVHLPDSYRYR